CQALAFGQTLRERIPGRPGGPVVFVGDGNNVCSSLMILCASLGYDFTVACAPGYEPPPEIIDASRERASHRGAEVAISHDPATAVARASAIYTDVWASMGQENEAQKRARDFEGFQINAAMLSGAPADVLVSHCLPAHRGEEITDEVLDSARCMAFDEAENRLHVQKAVIHHLFS
ncbi:MAG: ornithine carbamoyltransferase, partial [Chitinivibrionales bacterium]|nr:ornithine carbamoyltransferase [Chitinivibrionales bacterium]